MVGYGMYNIMNNRCLDCFRLSCVGKDDKAVAELSGTFVFCIVRLSFFLEITT
jgi:hypothetical protein